MPPLTPVTTPLVDIVALVFVVLHVPPVAVSDSVILLPTQTDVGPEMVPGIGNGFTVIVVVV